MIRSVLLRFAFALAILTLALSIPVHAQYPGYVSNSDDTGMPSYGAFVSSSIDTVNLLNQGLILQIPLMSHKSRGFDSSFALQYESKYWVVDTSQVPIAGTALFTTYYHWRPDTTYGSWANVSNVGGTVDSSGQLYTLEPCPFDDSDPPTVIVLSNWVYVGPDRTKYQLPLRKTYGVTGFPGCWPNFEVDNLVGHTDQGHILVDITNDTLNDHSGIKITRDDGTQISLGTAFLQKDTNGNFVNDISHDTLGRQLGSAYTDSNGNPQAFTITSTTLNITTAFPTTSYDTYHQVVQYSGPLSVISQITLPNGLSYTFSYDDPANPGHPNPFGEITKVTLPTGGYIKYKWGFVGSDPGPQTSDPLFTAYLDSRGIVEKDVSEDGTTERVWTYGMTTAGMTVTDPLGNKEIHSSFSSGNCTVNNTGLASTSPVDPGVEYLDASGHVLKIVAYDYCFDYGPVYSAQQGANLSSSNQNYTYGLRNPRVIRTTVTLPDTGQVSKSETDFIDTFTYSVSSDSTTYTDARLNPTETREYDYGSGAPGALMRKTDSAYLHNSNSAYLNAHIWNRVTLKTVYDSSGNVAAQTGYDYDSTAITSVTGVPNHDDANFPAGYTVRGNLTAIGRWLNTNVSWLVTYNYYNSVGNLVQTTDPGGHTYTLSYADNFTDGTNHNSQGFLTSVTGPVTNGVNHIEGKQYYWNTGLTAAVCGQNAPSPSSCVNTYSPSSGSPVADYAKYSYDALGRPTTVTHGDGGTTSFSFTEPSSPSPGSRITVTSTSAIDSSTNLTNSVVIDGLGRVIQTQLNSDPQGTDYVDTVYDEVGRVSTASNPHRGSSAPTDGTSTSYYDGAGRVVKLVPPDGSTSANNVTTVYSGNSITVTDEAGKQRRSFSDALGRLIEVDEPGSTSGATVSNGYVVISGAEQTGGGTSGTDSITFGGSDQFYQVETDPVCELQDCGGNCLEWSNGSRDGSPTFTTVYDSGNVSVTINGHTFTWGYGQSTTGASLASNFATSINGYSGSVVTASATGAVLHLTSIAHTPTAYTVSTSAASTDTSGNISGPSYGGTPATATLTGGTNDYADTGTVSVNVGGVSTSVSYGSGSTSSSVGSALAAAINANSSMYVNASASGGTVSFTSRGAGGGTDYSLTTGSSSNYPGTFSPSFSSSPSGPDLSGGNTPALSLLTPAVTLYTYDALNNLICVEQHGNVSGTGCSSAPSSDASSAWRVRRFTYDSLGRVVSSKNPESGTVSYTYDSDGNVLTKYDARGITTTMTYDQLHRVLSKTYSDGTTAASFIYDTPINWGLPVTNVVGRLSYAGAGLGESIYSYDARGRATLNDQCTPSICGVSAFPVSYSYNFAGAVTSEHTWPGITLNQQTDSAGRVTQLTSSYVDATHPATLVTMNSFTPAGAVSQLTYGNGLVETSAYNSRLQPTQLRTYNPTTNTDILNLSYGFANSVGANNGNLVTLDSTATQFFMRTYTYDELNRLSTMSSPADASGCAGLSWTYDAWANRISQNTTSGACASPSHAVMPNNRITDTGYTYDAAGNMTSDNLHTYTYDAENRLTQVDGGSSATYTYDAAGRRVQKIAGATTTEYIYDLSGNVVAETNNSNVLQVAYVHLGGSLLAEYENNNTYFVHKDHLGSTRVMTALDRTVYDSMDYLPFGEQIAGGSGSTHKFTGKEHDAESGLDNFEARYMSSSLGRFMSPDEYKYVNPADPQTLNLYGYVANNPINSVDPTGHAPEGSPGVQRYMVEEHGGDPADFGGEGAGGGEGPPPDSGKSDGNSTNPGSSFNILADTLAKAASESTVGGPYDPGAYAGPHGDVADVPVVVSHVSGFQPWGHLTVSVGGQDAVGLEPNSKVLATAAAAWEANHNGQPSEVAGHVEVDHSKSAEKATLYVTAEQAAKMQAFIKQTSQQAQRYDPMYHNCVNYGEEVLASGGKNVTPSLTPHELVVNIQKQFPH